MRSKLILLFAALAAVVFVFATNSDAAFEEQQPKGPAIFHSQADGSTILTDTTGLVCTWWRQLWICGNLYHIIDYKDNSDGVISACDYIKVEMTEAFGEPVDPPQVSWKHIERATVTLKLRKIGFSDSMFVEFSGGLDSLDRVVGESPVCTWWHEVWPVECRWWHIDYWGDQGSGLLDICDTLIITRSEPEPAETLLVHVEDIATDIEVITENPPGYPIPTTTEWGLVILVALLVTSAVVIMLRKRRVTVSA